MGHNVSECSVETLQIGNNQRFLGAIASNQISAVDGKSFLKGIRFVLVNLQ